MFRFAMIFIIVSTLSGLPAKPAYAHWLSVLSMSCTRTFYLLVENPSFAENRVLEFWGPIVQQSRRAWSHQNAALPEAHINLSAAEAISWLNSIRNESFWSRPSTPVGRFARIISIGGRQVVFRRSGSHAQEYGDGRVYTFQIHGQYDALAYLVDRYLGTNLVPPAVSIGEDTSIQLFIPSRVDAPLRRFEENANHTVDASHIRLLDLLMANPDRDNSANTLLLGSHLSAIDFNLSDLMVDPRFYHGLTPGMMLRNVTLEPTRWLQRTGPAPGLFSRRVIERLRSLNETTLRQVAEQGQFPIHSNEIQNILDSRNGFLRSLEKWISRYGESNLIVDP